jgi:mRNA interferase RelE/StbE
VYSYEFTSRALREIKKLNKETQRLIIKKIKFYCAKDLFLTSEHLTNSKLGNYRFRVGDYRVIFDIDGKMVTILKVGHRREIYR